MKEMYFIELIEIIQCKYLKCSKCGHEWVYWGNRKRYARCPECHFMVKIQSPTE
jgi:DNA-directed RNA polymerase subunit RPC12/RpoP